MNFLLIFLLKTFSKLPFRVLYVISDIIYFILFKVIGYRKKVVYSNLKNSFPDKKEEEINKIASEFYKYLCDLIVETIKIPSLSIKELQKRCEIDNFELFRDKYDEGQSFILVLGHQGNYEWANLSLASRHNFNFYGIFHPLKNERLNDYFKMTRGRFGTKLIPMKGAYEHLDNIKDKTAILGFIADQSPKPTNAYWTTFLNQDTGFYWGVEKIAKEYNIPVVFVDIKRTKRGHYRVFPEIIVENPSECKEGEITEMHIRKLEENIKEQPETWFWSHRRWKHQRP